MGRRDEGSGQTLLGGGCTGAHCVVWEGGVDVRAAPTSIQRVCFCKGG